VGLLTGASPARASASAAAMSVPRRRAFAALRGRRVTLTAGRVRVRARVTAVEGLVGAQGEDARRYSVLLKPASRVPDGLYRVRGRGLSGRPTLFFANVDIRAAARLQAVVNSAPSPTSRGRAD